MQEDYSNQGQYEEYDIKEIILKYLRNWKLYLVFAFISIILTNVYLIYQTPLYNASASILVKDDDKGSILSSFEDIGIGQSKNKLENEIEIFKSRKIISKVAKDLRANIRIYDRSKTTKNDLYKDAWLKINFINGDSSIINNEADFNINLINAETFEFQEPAHNHTEIYKFGDIINSSLGPIILTPSFDSIPNNKNVLINIITFDQSVSNLKYLLSVEAIDKKSDVLSIFMKTDNIRKGIETIDNLIKQHNNDAISDKNQVSKNTLDFINDRINYITAELA